MAGDMAYHAESKPSEVEIAHSVAISLDGLVERLSNMLGVTWRRSL